MRRYYVTVHGGGDATLLPPSAGEILRQQAMTNLRKLRIETGFDYAGMEIRGTAVNNVPGLDLATVRELIPAGRACDTRIIVAEAAVADGVETDLDYGLVLAISRGKEFSWSGGQTTFAANVCVNGEEASVQLSAVVLDLFQELMLANCASIQAVLSKFLDGGGSHDAFYRAKAEFASRLVGSGEATTLFSRYAPDRYASFATLARTDLYPLMDKKECLRFATLWSQFLRECFADSFLDTEEAVSLVRFGAFHRARPELVHEGGVRPGGRVRYGFVSEAELRKLLGDPEKVRHTGAYILCIQTGTPKKGDVGDVGALFGWRRSESATPKRLRLCTEDTYREMVPLVRKGLATPVRLFLKSI